MQKPKPIKPDISVLSVEPKYIDKFWPLCDFMIAEALKYSGGFAEPKDIKDLLKKMKHKCFLSLVVMKKSLIKSSHYL